MIGVVLALAAAAPKPGDIKAFKDWIVGCDNGLLCQADGVMPEDNYDYGTIAVRRAPEGDAIPEIWLNPGDSEAADVVADGKPLGLHLTIKDQNYGNIYSVSSADSFRLISALMAARSLSVVDRHGKTVAPLSPSGATAALLYMDEQQHRVGTATALVRKGDAPASSVPPPPPLPEIVAATPSAAPPVKLRPAQVKAIRGENACEDAKEEAAVEYDRLDARSTLALVEEVCASGAYNYIYEPVIVDNGGKYRDADFDQATLDEDGVYNAGWEPETRRLLTGFKGRGIGDCGSRSTYAWDGQRFRLVELEEMDDCRGSMDFITLWRASVVEKH